MDANEAFGFLVKHLGGFNHYMDSSRLVQVGPYSTVLSPTGVAVVTVSMDIDGETIKFSVGLGYHEPHGRCSGGIRTEATWLVAPSDAAATKMRLAL